MTFTAIYDLAVSPVSWDIVPFLVRARMVAGEQPLHVAINPKPDGHAGFARRWGGYDESATAWRLWNIVIPCCQLMGATVEVRRERSAIGCPVDHRLASIMDSARLGHPVPKLRASEQARRYIASALAGRKPVITITLRNVKAGDGAGETARNSNAGAWNQFYAWLYRTHASDYEIVLLPDSDDALSTIGGVFACLSPDLRLALYEHAAMNFVGQNGPSALCWFSGAPFIQLGCGGHFTDPPAANWVKHWADMGLTTGQQLPWASPDQSLCYGPDTFENIVSMFQSWRRDRLAAA